MLNYDCSVKKTLGGREGLLQILKDAGRASAFERIINENPELNEDTEIEIRTGPVGEAGSFTTLRQLRERIKQLENHGEQCWECPANMFGRVGGCSGAINYPISARAEEWLMDLLPDKLEGDIKGELFKAFIKDFKDNARLVDMNRPQGLYELRKPLEDVWGKGLFGKTKCTSSIILGNLFFAGIGNKTYTDIEPLHGAMMCWFLGAIDRMPTDRTTGQPQWLWDMDKLPHDEAYSIQNIALLLRTLYQGYLLGISTYCEP
jgi:hypothetical protein